MIKVFTLTYLTDGNGIIEGEAIQQIPYGFGGRQVTAIPNTDCEFIKWSDGKTFASRQDNSITKDTTYTAMFKVYVDRYIDIEILVFYTSNNYRKVQIKTTESIQVGNVLELPNGGQLTVTVDQASYGEAYKDTYGCTTSLSTSIPTAGSIVSVRVVGEKVEQV